MKTEKYDKKALQSLKADRKRAAKEAIENASSSAKKKKKTKVVQDHVKDPTEAINYLHNWKHVNEHWKFNKNTQSWLFRHLYEVDKLPKTSFDLLTEYLRELKGQEARDRLKSDALKRAKQYKEYEANKDKEEQDEKDNDATKNSETKSNKSDDTWWTSLDEHDKRKVYKRARKVLEVLKEA